MSKNIADHRACQCQQLEKLTKRQVLQLLLITTERYRLIIIYIHTPQQ